jgi:glutamate-5-semialdehyde dehydrogenase
MRPNLSTERDALTTERVTGMADALDAIANRTVRLAAPSAAVDRPNGLKIDRVSACRSVIAMIYESR